MTQSRGVAVATWIFNVLIAGLLASNLLMVWEIRGDNTQRDARIASFEEFKIKQERSGVENAKAHREFMIRADGLEESLRQERIAWDKLRNKLPYAAMDDRAKIK